MLPMVATKSNVKDESFNSSLFGELSPISSNNTPDDFRNNVSDQKMMVDDSAHLSFNEYGELKHLKIFANWLTLLNE